MSCSNKIRNFLDSVRGSPRGEDLVLAIFFAQIVEGLSASACKGRFPASELRGLSHSARLESQRARYPRGTSHAAWCGRTGGCH